MNPRLSALLTTAIVSGLLAAPAAKAEDSAQAGADNTMSADKHSCKGEASGDKHSCKGQKTAKAKKMDKKADKNSCKNGCGEAKSKKDESKE